MNKIDKLKIIITIANQEYQGFVKPRYYKQLCEFLEKHDGTTYLRVYPKTFPEPRRNFILQGWHILDWKKDIAPQNKANEFVIKGIWQYISQSETPVITIYRNQESQDPTGKYLPTHLPVEMSRTDYQAFQFDPNATEQAKRYFFQGSFEFDTVNNCFVWREDLAAPTDRLPPYRKPTKNPVTATEKLAKDISENPVHTQESTQKQETEAIIIMLDGKTPELSIKFSQKPELPSEGKMVNLQITGENGIVVKAAIARKTLAKQIEKMDSYDDWVAVLSGKMVAISPDRVVELEGAGINVFEKKAKETKQETE